MNLFDIEAAEKAKQSIDAFIEKRARESDAGRERETMYAESVRCYHARRQERNRAAWHAHHCYMQQSHARLAAEHEARAKNLLEGKETTDN